MELRLSEDRKFLIIDECTELEYEQMRLSLTKRIEGWRFHPLVKKRLWDGYISYIKGNKIPSGLWKEVLDIGQEYNFEIKMAGIKQIFDEDIKEEAFTKWAEEFFAKHPKFQPRDYQIQAAFRILKYRRCLAELATSAGKTLISFMVIAYLLEVLRRKESFSSYPMYLLYFKLPKISMITTSRTEYLLRSNRYMLELRSKRALIS